MDVTTTFLYGTLDENIYMKQAPGYEVEDKEDMVCHLPKSIYGLKQSSKQWNIYFDTFISSIGYIKNSYDSCVYKKVIDADTSILLLLYVDCIQQHG